MHMVTVNGYSIIQGRLKGGHNNFSRYHTVFITLLAVGIEI